MKQWIATIVLATILAGGGVFCGIKIIDMTRQLNELQLSYITLESNYNSLQSNYNSLESNYTVLQSNYTTLESERASLQADLSRSQAETQMYKARVADVRQQLSELQKRLRTILEITVTQHYQWDYRRRAWQWELPIPLSVYVMYLEKPRPTMFSQYADMARDPMDDLYIDDMVQKIDKAATERHFTEVQKLNFVIAFVQSLPYTVDAETTPYDEYPRYPVETLFDRGGDCEDTSILVAAILDRLGYDVALLHLKNAEHVAVGVSVADTYGSYYEYEGKKYFYLETTGEGWEVGQIPPSITDTHAYIYPLGS